MGLAASQAKLLSLTSRISDNELRSQSITAAKMALANQTTEASREYMKALNTNEFIYRTYDESGEKVYTALTGTQLSVYAPLKNQYALINPQGQVLVSENDAANFEASGNMTEFLEKYDVHQVQIGTNTLPNPDYDKMYAAWLEEHNEWKLNEPDGSLEKFWDTKPIQVAHEINPFRADFNAFEGSAQCYDGAMSGDKGCYLHVLACLIDFELARDENGNLIKNGNNYANAHFGENKIKCTTSLGNVFYIEDYGYNDAGQYTNSSIYENTPVDILLKMEEISKAIKDGYQIDEDHVATIYAPENPQDTLDASSSDKDKILSSYYIDNDGNKNLKTMYQYLTDLYYAIKNYNDDLTSVIDNFHDNLNFKYFVEEETKVHNQVWEDEYNAWLAQEPEFVPPDPIDDPIFGYDDKDKAQWYINLWHRMNGESEEKTITDKKQWNILEDGLMNSQDWLKYALESGTVSLERVNFSEPTEEGTGLRKAAWTSIIYTNALDISEQTDETAIARAEAKYQQKTREIENKDKQYDSMLKLLDTEHNALQQEYDTTKEVIKKNTDRTLKIYQA